MELQMCLEKEPFSSYSYEYANSTNTGGLQTVTSNASYLWEMDHEKEINGDVALIPELTDNSNEIIKNMIESPPTVDIHRLMTELQDFISIDPTNILPTEESFVSPLQDNNLSFLSQKHSNMDDVFNLPNIREFDLTKYLTDEEPKPQQVKISEMKPRAGMKKIDLQAQKYIIDNGNDNDNNSHSNIETEIPPEVENAPALEACDLYSLLERFEATQYTDFPQTFMEDSAIPAKSENDNKQHTVKIEDVKHEIKFDAQNVKSEAQVFIKMETKLESNVTEEFDVDQFLTSPTKQKKDIPHHPVKIENDKPTKSAPTIAQPKTTITRENNQNQFIVPQEIPIHNTINVPCAPQNTVNTTTFIPQETPQLNNRKVLNELPQELITRIKENRKRKGIAVIPPIPTKKRGGPKTQEGAFQVIASNPVVVKVEKINSIELDHNYCSRTVQPKKETAKEDERTIMSKQPMVKNADGTLMVSLLKVNTIHSTDIRQKKKLNIAEYKKRREGKLKPRGSQSNSASSSTCSSPTPEDENTRIQRHQEKLMRMAMEVLNTRPKSEQKQETIQVVAPPVKVKVPRDMEMKTYVSIGCNTDFKICKDLDPVTPVQQLEEIKPLLKKAGDKFSCNSLITSLIENIPKAINNCRDANGDKGTANVEYSEDKTIMYLKKDRPSVATKTVAVQTNISLIQQTKEGRYRRRRDSSSSSSSDASSRNSRRSSHYDRRRNNSDCSSGASTRSSKSSYYSSSRSHSRSRSRSRSPPPSAASSRHASWEKERFREVEERRVVYVGRISHNTNREQLRERFERFGTITNISLHFRDHGYLDNYGFVTFANQYDAFAAIEHGNDDPYHPKYDLSFGGRRQFCITSYSDLDNMRDETTYYPVVPTTQDSFDSLLREAQEKLRRRKF